MYNIIGCNHGILLISEKYVESFGINNKGNKRKILIVYVDLL